jgi:hypothetical protein
MVDRKALQKAPLEKIGKRQFHPGVAPSRERLHGKAGLQS